MPDPTPEALRLAKKAVSAGGVHPIKTVERQVEDIAKALDNACIRELMETLEAGIRPMSPILPFDACRKGLKILRGE